MGKHAQRKRREKELKKEEERKLLLAATAKNAQEQRKSELPAAKPLPPVPGIVGRAKMAADSQQIIEQIKGKKVIAFLQEAYDCCSEKCILEYIEYFSKDNYANLLIPRQNYADILKYLASYVVLFRTGCRDATIHEVKTLLGYISHLKSLGIRVVYYADDLIFWGNNSAPLVLAKASDAIIVTNETLANILKTKGQVRIPIYLVPTHIKLSFFDTLPAIAPTSLSDDRFKILLTSQGRIGINHAFEICEIVNDDPILANKIEWIFNANGVAQVRSVVNRFRNLRKVYIDWLALDKYYSLIKSVDLILHPAAPADLNYLCTPDMQQTWLDSKSEVKYTLAGAAKIPIISSPVASYKAAIKDGETGFLANTAEDFVSKIKELVDNRDLCRKVGLAARKDIEERYNITDRYITYRDAIIGALGKSDSNLSSVTYTSEDKVFIPPIEGGPRTFYENMKQWLPVVSKNKWSVTENPAEAKAAIAIAFVFADEIIKEKKERPTLKVIYRLDGLPMDFSGQLEPTNLAKMQEMFKYADAVVWQSQHCAKMWRDRNLIPPDVISEGPIIHNGVDLSLFKADGKLYSFPNSKEYNLLNLNWSTFHHKRFDLLQKTIEQYKDNQDIRFFLIGNYISTSQIANVNFWRSYPNVTYLGQMRNQSREAKEILASIYRAATALVFTSEMEGSPNTVLEAMGCGCPVIYNSAVDIVPEILGDACLPLERMAEIFEMEKRQVIKDAIRPIAEKYSIENCVRQYLTILES